jgi:hypothetical protein
MFAALVALTVLAGCRREDVREFTLTIPDLCASNQTQIAEALGKYNGIVKGSLKWDFSGRTLSLKYDSMQIAKENIRQAIEDRNIRIKR